MSIYFRLRELLQERGIPERQFALDNKIRHGTLYDICNNKIERLPVHIIDKVCTALDVEPGEWIVRKKDTPN